ncbi:flagellar biosynthetic protein FliO [Natronincola ferrireducens]|uniref:Flagellar biosynthesis protein, FliO n=1 Tax=Natronincola ferrireducens TaxID=393762 RepID=A0A1G9C2T4_9FIRM|nr:flagellar biosynthetic protein FliO [Natronincola ferrireducens]SDK45754.1 Flagellar biosynthesis protein, FliO [Natronincola ferrireducens]
MLQNNIYTIFSTVIMAVFVIFIAYYTTVIISKKSNFYLQDRTVKILERTGISTHLNITIIQIADKVYILAVQNKNTTIIDSMDFEKWHEYRKNHYRPTQSNFASMFKNPFSKIIASTRTKAEISSKKKG